MGAKEYWIGVLLAANYNTRRKFHTAVFIWQNKFFNICIYGGHFNLSLQNEQFHLSMWLETLSLKHHNTQNTLIFIPLGKLVFIQNFMATQAVGVNTFLFDGQVWQTGGPSEVLQVGHKLEFSVPVVFLHFVLLCHSLSQSSFPHSAGCLGNSKGPPERTLRGEVLMHKRVGLGGGGGTQENKCISYFWYAVVGTLINV